MKPENKKKSLDLPSVIRAASVSAESIDMESRTVEMVFATNHGVVRGGFFTEPFLERLSMKQSHVRMDRFKKGAPFLDSHNQDGLARVLGVVESAKFDGERGVATVRFSKRAEVDSVLQDIKDGILRNVSVGYRVHRFEEMDETDEDTGLPVFEARDWEPVEISAVAAPADPDAQFRSSTGQTTNSCAIIYRNLETATENLVADPETDGTVIVTDAEKSVDEIEKKSETLEIKTETESGERKTMDPKEIAKLEKAAADKAKLDEKTRQADIKETVRKAGFASDVAEKFIADDSTVDAVRAAVIDMLAEKDKETETKTAITDVSVGRDAHDKVKTGVEQAILERAGVKTEIKEGESFRYMSLMDLGKEVMRSQGMKFGGLPQHKIAEMALGLQRAGHTTSDFPEILANVANKSLRMAYEAAPKTWAPFTKEVSVRDFKQISRTQLGEGDELEKVYEKGEIKRGTVSEAAEKYALGTYAKIYCFSREMLINDDMSAFDRMPQMMAQRARDLENKLIFNDIINANPLMGDGVALFHASHGNLGSAGVPSETTLNELRKLMRLQTGLDAQKLNLSPVFLYVPPSLETTAEKLVASIIPDSSANVSPFSSSGRTPLQLAVEPRLEDSSATAYYIFAGKSQIDMIELARLEGQSGPQISTREGWDVLGQEMRIVYDVAAKAIDHRGMSKNAG